jgi:F-type H+-transporting ATPase subunit gamma
MTRRRILERHRHSLTEIRDIMNSMRTLAHIEVRKLARLTDAQNTVVHSIEDVAADFLGFHPETLTEASEPSAVYLLIGTERGFCGDFNHALLRYLESVLPAQPTANGRLIAVGRKLHAPLEKDARVSTLIDGASVAEDVPVVLSQMVYELTAFQERHDALTVYGIYHSGEDGIITHKLVPPFQDYLHQAPRFPHPPVLNQPPPDFLVELMDHYLFAALHQMLYTSLMAENRRRVAHLEGAVKHLDNKSAELSRQSNALRQEEIIEEIEVILLSAASVDESWHERNSSASSRR